MFLFTERTPSMRKKQRPSKFKLFWDMNIPTQYYEEEFLDFERNLEIKPFEQVHNSNNPHAIGDYILEKYEKQQNRLKTEKIPVSKCEEISNQSPINHNDVPHISANQDYDMQVIL